jgi:cytoskeletal protein CcmA (bactofilin family)
MSWFKNPPAGENSMKASDFEARAARSSSLDPRLAEFDVKPPVAATPPAPPAAAHATPAALHRAEPKPAPEAPVAAEPEHTGSVFGASLRFKGELRAEEDFVLQGRIEGSIHHTQNLTIGTDGVVKGDSRARTIVVEGTVEGDLYALESINIRPTAKVQGNLLAPRVAIADGASFNGKIDMASAARAARSIVERQAANPLDERSVEQVLNAGVKS